MLQKSLAEMALRVNVRKKKTSLAGMVLSVGEKE